MRTLPVVLSVAFTHAVLQNFACQAEDIKTEIMLHRLSCESTTDFLAQDEVYTLLLGNSSKSGAVSGRVPRDVWNLNDDGAPAERAVNGVSLWKGAIAAGESFDFFILFLEEDQKRDTTYVERYRKLLEQYKSYSRARSIKGHKTADGKEIERILREIVKAIAKELQNDKDDLIGVAFVRFWNENGKLKSEWKPFEKGRFIDFPEWKKARPESKAFKFDEGSEYTAVLEVKQ